MCRLYAGTGRLLLTERGVIDRGSGGEMLVVLPISAPSTPAGRCPVDERQDVWLAVDTERPRMARVERIYTHPTFGRACVLRVMRA
jgi:hypothetical protein